MERFDGPPPPDTCVTVSREPPAQPVELTFVARFESAEVVCLLDTSDSMKLELDRIRTRLRTPIIPRLREIVPELRVSVAAVEDFPRKYGKSGDEPFRMWQPLTEDVDRVSDALSDIDMGHGGDRAESQLEGLYQIATGAGRDGYIPAADCPPHTIGYPCFRRAGARIILLFTDALFHNGPSGEWPYEFPYDDIDPATYPETIRALRRIGAKVLGLYSGQRYMEPEHRTDLEAVARDTGAVGPDGEPIVFDIGGGGYWLDEGVAETVRTLVEEVPLSLDLLIEDIPGDEIDATRLVRSVEAVRASPPSGARAVDDRFAAVDPGTRVTFRLRLDLSALPPADEARRIPLRVILRGDGAAGVRKRIVHVMVPAVGSEGVTPACEEASDEM